MKKMILIIIAVAVSMWLLTGVASANFAIHGGYVADTDACAGCHRAHTATSAITWVDNSGSRRNALLVGPPTTQVYVFCYVCHSDGAPGAATNVQSGWFDSLSPGGVTESDPVAGGANTLNGGGFEILGGDPGRIATSWHEYKGAAWPAWGNGTNYAEKIFMDCASCHDPHGSSNYRILKDYVNGRWVGGYVDPGGGTPGGAVDPDPLPMVVSNEIGFPLVGSPDGYPNPWSPAPSTSTGSNPTHGFRLHRAYNNADRVDDNTLGRYEYIPNYTTARYARGADPRTGGLDFNKGMSSWCTACHENYMAKVSISEWAKYGTENPASPNPAPWLAGAVDGAYISPMQTVVTTTTADIDGDDLVIPVADTTGFPDPVEPKYIGLWNPDAVDTNGNPIPVFEMVQYTSMTGTSFNVPLSSAQDASVNGRGQFGTVPRDFPAGTTVYMGYDAGDGYGGLVRHRHPINVPFTVWQDTKYSPTYIAGDRALVLEPSDWQAFSTSIPYVDIPLDHEAGYLTPGSEQANQTYDVEDWIECLTCHRAHGTDATMTGYARAILSPMTIDDQWSTLVPQPVGPSLNSPRDEGVPPTGDSALLRANNRGVCERCHNK